MIHFCPDGVVKKEVKRDTLFYLETKPVPGSFNEFYIDLGLSWVLFLQQEIITHY